MSRECRRTLHRRVRPFKERRVPPFLMSSSVLQLLSLVVPLPYNLDFPSHSIILPASLSRFPILISPVSFSTLFCICIVVYTYMFILLMYK